MAKKYRPKVQGHDAGLVVTTKSPYGSHADMVVELEELQSIPFFAGIETSLLDDGVVCKDDKGYYITLKARLDNGLADPNRYSSKRN